MGRTFGGRDYGPGSEGGGNDVPRGDNRESAAPYQQPNGGNDVPRNTQDQQGRVPERGEDRGGGRQGYDNRGGERGGYEGGARGGGNRGGGSGGDYNRDPNYAMISYLYATGNKGGFSVFLKRDMLEILKSLEEDDVIGISPSGGKNGAPMGWMFYSRRIPQEDKENYRRNGGNRGGGRNGGGYRR